MHAKHKAILFIVLYLGMALFLSIYTGAGYAQQNPIQTPSDTEYPVSTGTVNITETNSLVQIETDVSSLTPESNLEKTRRVLVKISPNARLINVITRMEPYGRVIENSELTKLGVFILDIPDHNFDEKLVELGNISGVSYVEPDYPVHALDTIPNDPSFPSQYGLTAIRAPQGWDLSTGSSSVTIAVLDSGIDLNHFELAGKLTQGYDFVNGDNIPQDDYGHGTHVAGIAAAWGNNGLGIAGVSWGANIMPVKVLDSSGGGNYSGVAAGIIWATDQGAQVINMSLGGSSYSQILQDAVIYADSQGTLIVAASGNLSANIVLYPARFPQVMAVAATNAGNQHASFSNYGSEIDIAAPGENILSLWIGGYNTMSGTSMATPFVSGLAAILLGYENNADVVQNYLQATALDISPPGWDIYTGSGLIQMDAAIQRILFSPTEETSQPSVDLPIQDFPTFIPVWSHTPSSTITAFPVTTTASLLSPSDLQVTETATPRFTPTPKLEVKNGELDFLSPYFWCGTISMLIGMLILLVSVRRRSRHRRFL